MSAGEVVQRDGLLSVRSLVKRWGGLIATDHVDLDIVQGETHALIGPNGAGKTTLVNQLAGSLKSNGGSIVFDGHDMTRWPIQQRVRAGIARSYQITSVFKRYTVLANVMLPTQARSGTSFRFTGSPFDEPALIEAARQVLDDVGLAAKADIVAGALAHGEQRKLEIALALATAPRLLLLDEPLAGMGAADADAMVELIASLKTKLTMVLVEHDMGAVFRLADRISVLVYGRVLATGSPESIRASPLVKEAYLGEESDVF